MESQIASLCLNAYKNLPKQHLCKENEWDVVSGIVVEISIDKNVSSSQSIDSPQLALVCLATGTRCLGSSQISEFGNVLLDMHAEVLARRALLRQLYQDLYDFLNTCSQFTSKSNLRSQYFEIIFQDNSTSQPIKPQIRLRSDVRFHLYISQPPCGAASDGIHDNHPFDSEITPSFAERSSSVSPISKSRDEVSKSMPNLRLKPGRSDLPMHLRTRSYSCSDKIAKWMFFGIQSALLGRFLRDPIYLSSITVGAPPKLSENVKLALDKTFCRNMLPTDLNFGLECTTKEIVSKRNMPKIVVVSDSSSRFEHSKLERESRNDILKLGASGSSGASVIWTKDLVLGTRKSPQRLEIISGKTGLRLGVSAKTITTTRTKMVNAGRGPLSTSNSGDSAPTKLSCVNVSNFLVETPSVLSKQSSYSALCSLAFFQCALQIDEVFSDFISKYSENNVICSNLWEKTYREAKATDQKRQQLKVLLQQQRNFQDIKLGSDEPLKYWVPKSEQFGLFCAGQSSVGEKFILGVSLPKQIINSRQSQFEPNENNSQKKPRLI